MRRLLEWWQRRAARRKMERVFSRGKDPYGYRSSPYELERLSAMDALLGPGGFERVLEVGCAEGEFTQRLVRRARRVTALDISPTALERARRRLAGGPVEFHQADLRVWRPAPPARFDLAVLGEVLYYLDKAWARRAFDECFRGVAGWLEPGGRLLLAHGFINPAQRALRQSYRERFERLGLVLEEELEVVDPVDPGGVRCLVSRLRKPA